MNNPIKIMLAVAAVTLTTQASAQLTVYDREDFADRSFTTSEEIRNLRRSGFNDRASSVVVRGGRGPNTGTSPMLSVVRKIACR